MEGGSIYHQVTIQQSRAELQPNMPYAPVEGKNQPHPGNGFTVPFMLPGYFCPLSLRIMLAVRLQEAGDS